MKKRRKIKIGVNFFSKRGVTSVAIFVFAFFMRESSYCFQRVLAIAILSVRLSVGGSVKSGAS